MLRSLSRNRPPPIARGADAEVRAHGVGGSPGRCHQGDDRVHQAWCVRAPLQLLLRLTVRLAGDRHDQLALVRGRADGGLDRGEVLVVLRPGRLDPEARAGRVLARQPDGQPHRLVVDVRPAQRADRGRRDGLEPDGLPDPGGAAVPDVVRLLVPVLLAAGLGEVVRVVLGADHEGVGRRAAGAAAAGRPVSVSVSVSPSVFGAPASASVTSRVKGVWPPSCSPMNCPSIQTRARWSTAPKCTSTRGASAPNPAAVRSAAVICREYQTTGWKPGSSMPEATDSGGNGTRMSRASGNPFRHAGSSPVLRKDQVPSRSAQRERIICGRGYSPS